MVLAQCFGLMPVVGVKTRTASQLRFKWNSVRTVYSFVVFLLLLGYAIMTVIVSFEGRIQFDRVATKWPRVMRHWETIEAKMPKYRNKREKAKLAHHVKMLSFVVLMCSFVEHSLTIFSTVHYSKYCLRQEDPFKELLKTQLSQLFAFLPYSHLAAFLGKFTTLIATFTWNYMDLFVMMISVGLSSRFKQINEELERVKGEHMSEDFWALRRSQYRKLCNLCFIVDDAISQLTFLSFSNNLFFICVQLLRSIRPMRSIPHAIYFWFSLIFLISRTVAVSLYSSQIHDESKKPIIVLRSVPNHSWGIEVRRFCEQVVNDTVALTGMRFFFLTRKLILTVAGTIITYELVLVQFHTEDFKPDVCRNAS
ncbi:gustatory receptor for sugar taste 64f-like [Sitodiplosis mosellana]|uniref:gustatory receptor for sugar taste 64f-like n=1 Tax=Sitodiplosis mosellana TaxID=263140 RepID=UPI002444F55B|nr:gustatory receptor for sugar taste 64f-like [Sitodiplosis mosellana]